MTTNNNSPILVDVNFLIGLNLVPYQSKLYTGIIGINNNTWTNIKNICLHGFMKQLQVIVNIKKTFYRSKMNPRYSL